MAPSSSRIRRFTRRGAIHLQVKFANANLMRSRSRSRIFFEEKDEAFIHQTKTQKPKNLSRMGEFISPEAIQLKAKFA